MNEKLKELAHQAGLEFATNSVDMPIIVAIKEGKLADPKAGLEKFAELIVRECAEVANDHNSEAEGITLGVGRVIKEHFGVEE